MIIETFKNIIPKENCNDIEKMFLSPVFPWYYNSVTSILDDDGVCLDDKTLDSPQFTHIFVKEKEINSEYFKFIMPVVEYLENNIQQPIIKNLHRVKANLILQDNSFPTDFYNVPHVDSHGKHNTIIYYVNDSDGDTIIFNESIGNKKLTIKSKFSPISNTAVFFDSKLLHASTPPRKNKTRIVLNIIYESKESYA
jgi:hypothetical protein